MGLKLITTKEQLKTTQSKTIDESHKEMMAEIELERLNIQLVRDMAENFWDIWNEPSDLIKYRHEIKTYMATMTDAIISYWGEGSEVTLDKCHRKFKCTATDGRIVWI